MCDEYSSEIVAVEERAEEAERLRVLWFNENSAARAVLGRVRELADEWQAELDSRAIRDKDARYCWGLAVRELRAALGDA